MTQDKQEPKDLLEDPQLRHDLAQFFRDRFMDRLANETVDGVLSRLEDNGFGNVAALQQRVKELEETIMQMAEVANQNETENAELRRQITEIGFKELDNGQFVTLDALESQLKSQVGKHSETEEQFRRVGILRKFWFDARAFPNNTEVKLNDWCEDVLFQLFQDKALASQSKGETK